MPLPSPSSVLLRTQSDARLVELAREGHERAFEAIVERYRKPLHRYVRRMLPAARVEDVLQTSFMSAWSAIQRGDEVRDLRPWMYRIVHNAALNQLRVSGDDYAELEDSLLRTEAPHDALERRAIMRETLTALAALPERQREALLRDRRRGPLPARRRPRARDVPDGAFRQLVFRARSTVRAAATAVTPLPLALWAASLNAGAGGDVTANANRQHLAELVGGAGASAFLAKAGAVAVLATGDRGRGAGDRAVERRAAAAVRAAARSPTPTPIAASARRSRDAARATAAPTRTPARDARSEDVPRRAGSRGAEAQARARARSQRLELRARSDSRVRARPGLRARPARGVVGLVELGSGSDSGSGLRLVRDPARPGPARGSRSGSPGSGSSGSGSSGSGDIRLVGLGLSGSGSGLRLPADDNSGPGSGSTRARVVGLRLGNSGSGSSGSGSGDDLGLRLLELRLRLGFRLRRQLRPRLRLLRFRFERLRFERLRLGLLRVGLRQLGSRLRRRRSFLVVVFSLGCRSRPVGSMTRSCAAFAPSAPSL